MKLSLRLILYLVVSISVVTVVLARIQVTAEKRGLRERLVQRAKILTESLQEAVEPVVQRNAPSQLRRIVERFGNREHLAGIAIYNVNGKLLAASQSLVRAASTVPSAFAESRSTDRGAGGFTTIDRTSMYVYALPLHRDTTLTSVLVTFHDASYIEAQSVQIRRETLWHILLQVVFVVLITLVTVRSAIVRPIRRLSQWVRDMRHGKPGTPLEPAPEGFLESLASELAHLGRNLAEVRTAASEEARLRDAGDSLWTAERLRAGVTRRLGGSSLFVVSNREPYHHVRGNNGIEIQVPASGLVTALEPILKACDGTWIAHGSASADREVVDAHDRLRVPPDDPHYTLRRVWLTADEENGYYFGFSNEGIWPLCHIAHTPPAFRAADWEWYRRVNQKFADAVLQEIEQSEKPLVLIQDYHFALLPRLIKEVRPDARVAVFWHIPWPNPEAFQICPWRQDLVDGLLGADVVAFHIQAHCNNFLETVDHAVECRIEWDRFTVNRKNHITAVRPHPISVVFREEVQAPANSSAYLLSRSKILPALGPEVIFLGVGVDRLDYTKGILERFRAIERFLDKFPQYSRKFSFVQFGAPTRTRIARYRDFLTEVEREVERINGRFQSDHWEPIVFYARHHSHREIEPFYQAADICLVTSLHDGMNLVAKEFVAAREDEDGVLILSRFTGACRELRDALLVNPYDIEEIAEMIRQALEMPQEERNLRMRQMRRIVKEHNVYRWAADLISELAEIRLDLRELTETR